MMGLPGFSRGGGWVLCFGRNFIGWNTVVVGVIPILICVCVGKFCGFVYCVLSESAYLPKLYRSWR